jgi:hypothetical protein
VRARVLAFAAIIVAGICGALIGGSLVSLQCKGSCSTATGGGSIVGAIVAAGGVAVVAVLTLRAMGEWRRISEEQLLGDDEFDDDEEFDDGADGGPAQRNGEGLGPQDGYSNRNPSA